MRQGTSQLTGWAFVAEPSGRFDGCVLYVLGTAAGAAAPSGNNGNGTTLDLSALLEQHVGAATGEGSEEGGEVDGWMLSVKYQAGGGAALLQNLSTVLHAVSAVPPNHQVTVPPYSVVTIDRASRYKAESV